ncbi:MAG: DUF4238 domain-containing protein [Flavobacteriales bacterium]|nr:DUF4238 domain-containing protein [Flavobacteriales bacterium]
MDSITDKKKQHYIPKFYLRNFSFKKNEKQIGLFHLKSKFYFQQAALKDQGSKKFFYGYDGKIENRLSQVEGFLSTIINDIIEHECVPKRGSVEHIDLLGFVALTDLRSPSKLKTMQTNLDVMTQSVLDLDPTAEVTKIVPTFNHDDAIKISLSAIPEIIDIMYDLEFKLLINTTSNPFITSDLPVVRYNQFLEQRKWPHGKTGYGNTGLQIFIPLNPRLMLVFYDPSVYKLGFRKQMTSRITKSADLDNLNILQFLNCIETVFFDDKSSEHYIRTLYQASSNFGLANQHRSKESYLIQDGDDRAKVLSEKTNLLIMGITDCEIRLQLDGLKMLSSTRGKKLHPTITQLRPWAADVIRRRSSRDD